jgi:L-arabinose isomerase
VRHGPATLLAITTCVDGSLRFVYAEAQSEAGAVLDIGNTVTRYRFSIGARRFVNEWNRHGPGHHCAIGIGRLGSKIEKLAQLIGIETTRVC